MAVGDELVRLVGRAGRENDRHEPFLRLRRVHSGDRVMDVVLEQPVSGLFIETDDGDLLRWDDFLELRGQTQCLRLFVHIESRAVRCPLSASWHVDEEKRRGLVWEVEFTQHVVLFAGVGARVELTVVEEVAW